MSVTVHMAIYCFTDLQQPTSVEKVPEIDLEAETQAYPILPLCRAIYLLLEDGHVVPTCAAANTTLPGTDIVIVPGRYHLMMDRNNPIILTFVFVNPTLYYRQNF